MKFWKRRKKRIQELEEEVEWLNEDLQLHKYCLFGIATRISNLEGILVAFGFTEYKEKEEKTLLN